MSKSTAEAATKELPVRMVPVADISTEVNNHRLDADPAKMKELVASIERDGILQPLKVTTRGDKTILVYGHRRLAAAKELKLEAVPALVADGLTDEEIEDERNAENIHRQNLNPVEEASIIEKRLKEGKTLEGIAARLGKSPTWARERLDLLRIDTKHWPLIASGRIPLKHALLIARVGDKDRQEDLIESVTENHYSKSDDYVLPVTQLRHLISGLLCKLGSAHWPKDAEYAGRRSCIGCPDNTNSEPTLFESLNIPLTSSKGNCTNPECFEKKLKVWEKDPEKKRREKEAEAKRKEEEKKKPPQKVEKEDDYQVRQRKINELKKKFPWTAEQKLAVAICDYGEALAKKVAGHIGAGHATDAEAVILAFHGLNQNYRAKPEQFASILATVKNGDLRGGQVVKEFQAELELGENARPRVNWDGKVENVATLSREAAISIATGETLCARWKIELPRKPQLSDFKDHEETKAPTEKPVEKPAKKKAGKNTKSNGKAKN